MVAKAALSNTLLAGVAAVAILLPLAAPATAAVAANTKQQASPSASGSAVEVVPARDRRLHESPHA